MHNVLFAMDYASPYMGNFMNSIEALSAQITENGGVCVYLFPKRGISVSWINDLRNNGKLVQFLTGNIFKDARIIKLLIKKYNIDIIHSHFASYRMHLPIRLARIGHKNVKYLVHVHSQPKSRNPFLDKLVQSAIKPTAYIAVSEPIGDKLSIKGYNVYTVLNSIDFRRLDLYGDINKDDYLSDGCEKSVLIFGYNVKIKGVDLALKALNDYDTEHKIQLLICAANNVDKLIDSIKEICTTIPPWVKILTPRNDIATYYKNCDVYLSASRTEGFGYALVESAYTMTPCVFTAIPACLKLNIPNFIAVEAENSKAIYDGIIKACYDETYTSASNLQESKNYVVENFSLGRWVYDITQIYDKLFD